LSCRLDALHVQTVGDVREGKPLGTIRPHLGDDRLFSFRDSVWFPPLTPAIGLPDSHASRAELLNNDGLFLLADCPQHLPHRGELAPAIGLDSTKVKSFGDFRQCQRAVKTSQEWANQNQPF